VTTPSLRDARARRNVRRAPPPNAHAKFPPLRGEAAVYEELARAAGAAGYQDVTASQIHAWVGAGLLPATSRRQAAGRRGFPATRSNVTPQLLDLCRHRRDTKSWNALRVLLWKDGWHIFEDDLRATMLAWLPASIDPDSESALDALDGHAQDITSGWLRRFRPGRIGPYADASVSAALSIAHGVLEPLDEETSRSIERVIGTSSGRMYHLPGFAPWLAGSSRFALNLLASAITPTKLRHTIKSATRSDFEAARPLLHFLVHDLPLFARMVELMEGRQAAGLRLFTVVTPGMAPGLLLIALALGAWPPAARRLGGLAGTADKERGEWQALVSFGDLYTKQHPEHVPLIRRRGLRHLIESGIAIPVEGAAELLDAMGLQASG
jgi:hypothetical protein